MTFVPHRAWLGVLGALALLLPLPAHAQLGSLSKKLKKKAQEVTGGADSASAGETTTGSRKVFVNYDFIPGQRTLFYTDFTDEEVGNFPRRLEFKSGSMEVVELDGVRALKASAASGFVPRIVCACVATGMSTAINRRVRMIAAIVLL